MTEGAIVSPETISLCLELLSNVSVPVTVPDAEAKMHRLLAARQELLAALAALPSQASKAPDDRPQ